MEEKKVRVRFAPAPTGMMHLGNIRTALMNYLFARQKNGTFVMRLEDTDPERNFDPHGQKIREDLAWLDLSYDEGPGKGGPHAPYVQSERTELYQKKLAELIKQKKVYRCFCTSQELEKKRQRQKALKMPPRYDRTCLKLSDEEIARKLENNTPFIWRFKLDHDATVTITDMARGTISFALKNFSDFPLTRQNGSFTFMFANAIDDMVMGITHNIRGEDHLTNTAGQAALLHSFNAPVPTYFHMPILCNIAGKKLSKRDFGFSLQDLKDAGFVPQAICNYLATLGGSFEDEIVSLEELVVSYNFDDLHSSGHIKYDEEKLRWMNHKWLSRYTPHELARACRPFLETAYPAAQAVGDDELARIVSLLQTDLQVLPDAVKALHFYFAIPEIAADQQEKWRSYNSTLHPIILAHMDTIANTTTFVNNIKQAAKQHGLPLRDIFSYMRLLLTGKPKGPSIHDIITILGTEIARARLEKQI